MRNAEYSVSQLFMDFACISGGSNQCVARNLLIRRVGPCRLYAILPRTASNSDTQTGRLVLALREQILQGQFSPSERLTELGLASRLNASRTPVRLALERLANEGLLDAIPSGGFRLRSFSLADIRDAIEIRGVLEGIAARFAAERFGGHDEIAFASCH